MVAQYRSSWNDDVPRVGVGHQDVEHGLVAEDRLELDVVVVHHQGLALLAGQGAELVEVLGVGDPLGLGGVDQRKYRGGAGPEVLDPQRLVVRQDLLDVGRVLRPADVHVPRGGLEPVLVEQRPVVLRAQAAQRERLHVAITHLAQAAQHCLQPRDRRRVGAETDVLGKGPQLNRDLADRDSPTCAVRCLGGRGARGGQAEAHRQGGDDDAPQDVPAAARCPHGALPWLGG